jgi:PAS domain-containing protein
VHRHPDAPPAQVRVTGEIAHFGYVRSPRKVVSSRSCRGGFYGVEVGRGQQAESALHRGEAHFRRLLEKLPAGAYTRDAEGLITYFNQHAVRLWGRAPKLQDPADRFCGSFRLFAPDGAPIRSNGTRRAGEVHDEAVSWLLLLHQKVVDSSCRRCGPAG